MNKELIKILFTLTRKERVIKCSKIMDFDCTKIDCWNCPLLDKGNKTIKEGVHYSNQIITIGML